MILSVIISPVLIFSFEGHRTTIGRRNCNTVIEIEKLPHPLPAPPPPNKKGEEYRSRNKLTIELNFCLFAGTSITPNAATHEALCHLCQLPPNRVRSLRHASHQRRQHPHIPRLVHALHAARVCGGWSGPACRQTGHGPA